MYCEALASALPNSSSREREREREREKEGKETEKRKNSRHTSTRGERLQMGLKGNRS